MRPLISVNLLLYQPKLYLEPGLRSILAQSYDNFELLIIDNNSGDDTVGQAQEIINSALSLGQKLPAHKIIINKKNLGFASAHNQGIRESRGELIVLANQDVILDADFLKIVATSFGDPAVASVQGKILRLKSKEGELSRTEIIDTAGLVILKNRRIIARGQGREDKGQYEEGGEIFGADGALPVYRRAALEEAKINGEYFDEDFYMYKEDVDLAWRLRLFGWKALYVPRALAWHARTSGDSVATNYLAVIRERLKINNLGKYQSFKNQRLMQIKNEELGLLLRHALWFLPKEIGAWLYVALFEHYTWRAIKNLFRQAPRAWEKRKMIMARKKINGQEMRQWFK